MQITVRLRRKTGKYALVLAALEVILNDFLYEVECLCFFLCLRVFVFFHIH